MQIEYGAKVTDQNDEFLGIVDYPVTDTWTGEIRKFLMRQKVLDKDLFLSPEDVLEAKKGTVKLNVTLEELNQKK